MDLNDFTEMKVSRLVFDPQTNSPIVVLQHEETGVMLPIWIGIFEAHSIAMKMEGVEPVRPMTHDLLSNTFTTINSLIERVEVTDLIDNTYFARIYFQLDEKGYSVDSRPSDAIALAIRTTTPIFVANSVLEKSQILPSQLVEGDDDEEGGEDRFTQILREFNPPDKDKLN